ncbi:MAG: MerR family transcriptional regulator [Thermodesulfobacteriota bacterium]|nr:MerR family transcriptional regulator [Thermodesulfobacteriota bacterium]
MVAQIYDLDEFIKKTGIDKTLLDQLIEAQVLRPAGQVDGNTPYFDEHGLEAAETISKLLEIGYSMEEVVRIRRKVGIPGKKGKRHPSGMPLLTVGELANRIDSNPRTIKHWEQKGILAPESHTPGGFRLYPESAVKFCQHIQDLQLFGYTLDEIKAMIWLLRDDLLPGKTEIDDDPEKTAEHVQQIKAQVDRLNSKIKLFEKGIDRWRRLLRQKGKELSALSSKLGRETQAGKEAVPAPENGEPAVETSKSKNKQRKKS